MMFRALSADWLKIRGKGIWFRRARSHRAGAMQGLNFGLRYDYLMKSYAADPWGGPGERAVFVPIALFLGITLVCSLMANVEHQLSSWKQSLALPISRTAVFSAKFVQAFLILCVSCLLLSISTAVLGIILGMGAEQMPYMDLFAHWLCTAICGTSHAGFSAVALIDTQEPGDCGRNWDYRLCRIDVCPAIPRLDAAKVAAAGLYGAGRSQGHRAGLLGAVITCVGLIHFNRKDVD